MTILNTFGWLAATLLLGLIAIAFGARVLKWIGVKILGTLERALLSAGISFALLQLAIFALLAEGWLRRGSLGILFGVMTLSAGAEWKIAPELFVTLRKFLADSRKSRFRAALVLAISIVLALEALMAMAPLTGSDALHYHFTTPSLWLQHGLAPLYGIVSSFGVGQAHMLIALGLALGSDHFSMGMIFLGGVFAVAALYVLARNWMSVERSLVVTLVFLLTPISFWQMSVAGSPDIWMMFYTTAAVLAAARGIALRSTRWAALAGFLAGAAAGAKYPAWIIPITLAAVFLFECRSFWLPAVSSLAAFAAGLAPLIRNAIWTGNPFFPYASNVFSLQKMNAYTLGSVLSDTHNPSAHPGILGWLEYPFGMVLNGQSYGVGHYFGPTVLAFAPLLLVAYRRGPLFRAAAWVWGAMFLSNVATSQMGRFLLPVFGIALAISFAGAETASKVGRPFVRVTCNASVALFLLLGAGALLAYGRDFLPVSVGLESREHFLEREAPSYQGNLFANRLLNGKPEASLVFFPHLYYLRINYVVGDPDSSWDLYPEQYATPEAMLQWLRQNNVRWIVRPPEYPETVAGALEGLEFEGLLQPVAAGEVEEFSGWRIDGKKMREAMRILEVRSQQP
jgi:Protein of unknown function (DUF1420)